MDIRKTIVPKKNGGGTTINYGFSSTVNNSGGNTNINTDNLVVNNLNSEYITASQINVINANISNANINNANVTNINANHITSDVIEGITGTLSYLTVDNTLNTYDLNVTHNALINFLQTEGAVLNGTTLFDILIGDSLTVSNLEVLKSAHFFELIIDKIKAAGGSILVTPADGFNVESTYTYNRPKYDSSRNSYTLYWQAAEDTYQALMAYVGKTLSDVKEGISDFNPPATLIQNMWQAGDQAICEEFNAIEGTNYNASNQYWWRVVKSASTEPILLEKTQGEYAFYNWIEVYAKNSNSQQEQNVVDGDTKIVEGETTYGNANPPKVGDTVAMLGNRNCNTSGASDDLKRRGSAIYLATYRSIDRDLTPPLFATYKGIDNFNLSSPSVRQNKIDANGTTLKGNFISESGDIIDGKSYRIIPSTNIITSTTNNNVTTVAPSLLQINYLYQDNGQATTSPTVPQGYILGWSTYDSNSTLINSGTITPLDASAISLPNNLDRLELELYTMDGSNKKVRDALSMKVTSLSNLKDGKNGEYTMLIYKDQLKTIQEAPTISSGIHPPTIPTGWTTYMPNVSLETYNIWASTGTVKYDSNNDIIPSNWSAAVQVNGINGIDGQTGPQGPVGPTGPTGPDGQTGADGLDGITRKLLPLRDACVIELEYSGTNQLNVTGKFSTDMQYQVIEIDANNNLTTINLSSNQNYKISSSFYNSSNQVINAYKEGNTQTSYTGAWTYPVDPNFAFWGWNSTNSYAYLNDNTYYAGSSSYNWLRDINGGTDYSADYRDFYKLITSTDGNMINRTPNRMEVKLLYRKTTASAWKTVDSLLYDIVLPSKGIFEHNEYMLRSVLYGSWGSGDNTIYGLSSINQTVKSISLSVEDHEQRIDGAEQNISDLTITASGISSTVTNLSTDLHDNYSTTTVTQSMINQSADEISLTVSKLGGSNVAATSITKSQSSLLGRNIGISVNSRYSGYEVATAPSTYVWKTDMFDSWYIAFSGNIDMQTVDDDMTNYIDNSYPATYYKGVETCVFSSTALPAPTNSGSPNISLGTKVSFDIIKDHTATSKYTTSIYVKRKTNNASKSFTLIAVNAVISDYAPASENVTIYGSSLDSTGDAYVQYYVNDNEWHRLYITYTPKATAPNISTYFRIYRSANASDGNDWLICMPQINAGSIQPYSVGLTEGGEYSAFKRTGIDIEQGKITLQADKVTFTDSTGTINDKISIDPTTGTLNAVNGTFSGIMTANINYTPFVDPQETSRETNSSEISGNVTHRIYNLSPTVQGGCRFFKPNSAGAPGGSMDILDLTTSGILDGTQILIYRPWPISQMDTSMVGLRCSTGLRLAFNFHELDNNEPITSIRQNFIIDWGGCVECIFIGGIWYMMHGKVTVTKTQALDNSIISLEFIPDTDTISISF